MMPKVEAVRKEADSRSLSLDIQVDGGVNLQTAKTCITAGANVLVAGSAVFHGSIAANTKAFLDLMGEKR